MTKTRKQPTAAQKEASALRRAELIALSKPIQAARELYAAGQTRRKDLRAIRADRRLSHSEYEAFVCLRSHLVLSTYENPESDTSILRWESSHGKAIRKCL